MIGRKDRMPKNDIEQLKATLEKVSSELSRQTTQGEKILEANDKKVRNILKLGLKGMDPGLHDIILEIYEICNKPHFPFLPGRKEK
jgi:hypothetical protein